MSQLEQLKYKYARLNVLEKIIAINVVVFLFAIIFRRVIPGFFTWLYLPSDIYGFLYKPWTIITYGFLHFDPIHILFNMLWLFFLGRMMLNLFKPKMALNIYFMGIIAGGVTFLFGYNVLPQIFSDTAYLIGASAGIRAILIFLCTYMPNKEMPFFTFNLKLWWIGTAIIAFDVLNIIGGNNAGGNLAHLGGAALGFLYAKQLAKGQDIGGSFERFMDRVSTLFKSNSKPKMKTVYKKSKVAGYKKDEFNQFNNQKKIDIILDKISKSGYDSLSKEEKQFLFKAGK
ncbi:rhomboid family intramembrane serine protease [Olleya sp. HaHaR_3_96]|uniref:rhomboid family intramembrane serine protease n=1 Tax=Olleya sp. HaHaR_3_96 TaxID=2745560 RepID=UPI001C4FE23B|nr:rhomboid family intramembrane serine protease [Olleya sp. HaHaR_3_96]QXP59676.1 rhomboid family intramembrane serine protease [Olleya sp. HaHaR_3_96]